MNILWTIGAMLLTGIVTGVLLFFLAKHYIDKQKQAGLRYIKAFFESPDGKSQSEFAKLTNVILDQGAAKIVTHAKSTFMGIQSGAVRGEKALAGAIAEDALNQSSPMLAGILSSFPAVSKQLRRNPELAGLAMSLLGNLKSGGNGQKPAGDTKPPTQLTF